MQPRAISLRVVVALVGLSSGAQAFSIGRGVAAARPRARVVRCAEPEWSPQEDWALQDQVKAYSAGTGADTATFWSAMAANVPALAARAPAELEARAAQLAVDGGTQVRPCTLTPQHAPRLQASAHIGSNRAPTRAQPALLDTWEQLADGRYAGNAEGRPVWLTVSLEGRLPSDPRESPGYIEALVRVRVRVS